MPCFQRCHRLVSRAKVQILEWGLIGGFLFLTSWVLTAQALAFLKHFRLPWAMAGSLILMGWFFHRYRREGLPFTFPSPAFPLPRWISWPLGITGAISTTIALIPLVGWPVRIHRYQPWVLWDVVYYHLPKAVDLLQKAHMWNLALPYGQYPIGWETLLALWVGVQGHALGLGILTALLTFLWIVLMWVLFRMEARLSPALALFAVGLLVVAPHVGWRLTPWHIIGFLLLGVGKNDLLAALLVLFGLLHARPERLHRWGYLLALSGAWAVKPWAGFFLLGWGLIETLRFKDLRLPWIGAMGLASLAGSLWLIRNLVLMGRPISPIGAILQRRALLWKITQPDFWNLPRYQLVFISGVLFSLLLWAAHRKDWRHSVGLLTGLYAVFIITPAVVVPAGFIQWRFALALLSWLWVLLARWGVEIWPWYRPWGRRAGLMAMGLALAVVWAFFPRISEMWMVEPRAARIIEDPFLEPVSEGPYRSVFAYIDYNLRHARIEPNVPFYYIYDVAFTNEGVRPGHFPAGLPRAVPQPQPTHTLFCSLKWTWRGNALPQDPEAVRETRRAWQSRGYRILYEDSACVLAQRPESRRK